MLFFYVFSLWLRSIAARPGAPDATKTTIHTPEPATLATLAISYTTTLAITVLSVPTIKNVASALKPKSQAKAKLLVLQSLSSL